MKKLLLYLAVILTLGTLSVDAFAGTKPIYVEKPSGISQLHLWWWGGSTQAQDKYDYNGKNNKPYPDLLTEIDHTEVTGSDGKTYLKVELDEETTDVRFLADNNNTFTSGIFDNVYNYNSSKYVKGELVGNVIKDSTDPTPTPAKIPTKVDIKYETSGKWLWHSTKDENSSTGVDVVDGKCEFKGLSISSGGFNTWCSYEGSDNHVGLQSDDLTLGTPKNLSESGEQGWIKFKKGSANTFDIIFDFNTSPATVLIKEHTGEVTPPVTDNITWELWIDDKKVDWTLTSGTYAASGINGSSLNIKGIKGSSTVTYGNNGAPTVTNGDVTIYKDNSKGVKLNSEYENFGVTFTPGNDLGSNITFNLTSTKKQEVVTGDRKPLYVKVDNYDSDVNIWWWKEAGDSKEEYAANNFNWNDSHPNLKNGNLVGVNNTYNVERKEINGDKYYVVYLEADANKVIFQKGSTITFDFNNVYTASGSETGMTVESLQQASESPWRLVVNGKETNWTVSGDTFKAEKIASGSTIAVKYVKDDVETVYGNNATVVGGYVSSDALTLTKGENAIVTSLDYHNYAIEFTPAAEITDAPESISVKLTSEAVTVPANTKPLYVQANGNDDVYIWYFKSKTEDAESQNIEYLPAKGYSRDGAWPNLKNGDLGAVKVSINGDEYYCVYIEETADIININKSKDAEDKKWQDYILDFHAVYEPNGHILSPLDDMLAGTMPQTKEVKVFFIDRMNWSNNNTTMYCYQYTDRSMPAIGGVDINPGDRNGSWPGQKMTEITNDEEYKLLKEGLADISGNEKKIFMAKLTVRQRNDGTFVRPKLIFNNNEGGTDAPKSQTLNLYLVENGIYTTGTDPKDESILPSQQVKASDYLPRQWYNANAAEGAQVVYTYPNNYVSTEYNYIYVDVEGFTNAYKNGNQVDIELRYDRSGDGVKNFKATGITGNHKLVPVTINGKDYLRCAIAEDVVPSNKNIQLMVWLHNYADGMSGNYDRVFNDGEGTHSHDAAADGKYINCPEDASCSLIYYDVPIFNGAVYRRGGEIGNIATETMPKEFYIVDLEPGTEPNAFAETNLGSGVTGKELGVKGTEIGADNDGNARTSYENAVFYKIEPSEGDGATNYVIQNLLSNAKFTFMGKVDVESGADGDTGWREFSNISNHTMLPGNNYPFVLKKVGDFTITDKYNEGAEKKTPVKYNLTVRWENQTVSIRVKPFSPDFKLHNGIDKPLGGAYHMYAVSDGSSDYDVVKIKHHEYFGTENADHYDEDHVITTFTPYTTYEKYFGEGMKLNKAAVNGALENDAENTSGLSSVKLRAYTAGIYVLKVESKSFESTDADGSKIQFEPTVAEIPVRVMPTIESVGLTLNFAAIENVGGGYKLASLELGSDGEKEDGTKGEDYIVDGIHWNGRKMGFFPTMAETGKVDGQDALEIHWAYGDGTSAPAAYTMVAREASGVLAATDDPYATAVQDSGLGRFTQKNAINYNTLATNGNKFRVQIKQNGINSPVYVVDASEAKATGVEEIEASEEAEAVYYDLNGVRVDADNLVKGIYVKVTGNKREKILVK